MLILVLGILIFLGVHLIPTNVVLRKGLAERWGENGYKMAFSLFSLVGFALIILGWAKLQANPGKNPIIWDPPLWTHHIALVLMLPAMVFLVAAYIPSKIRTMLKHPMLVAIKTWALAHLLANGDLASMVLFGSFLAYAVYDRISVGKRGAAGPLGAKTGGPLNDVIVLFIGSALYALLVFGGHEWLFGVSPRAALG
jgi:uncharacterized membrane protein